MEDFKHSDIHFPLSALNAGMMGYGILEGSPDIITYNSAFFALNMGLASAGRKDELLEVADKVQRTPDKGLGMLYDRVLSNRVAESVEGIGSDGDYGSRRRL